MDDKKFILVYDSHTNTIPAFIIGRYSSEESFQKVVNVLTKRPRPCFKMYKEV